MERISTGVSGLDRILKGGLVPGRRYLLEGGPGTGKTVFGLKFLAAGVERGETALCVNFEESPDAIRANAAEIGLDLDGVDFLDLSPSPEEARNEEPYTVFAADEVEGPSITDRILDAVDDLEPDRIVIDPVTQLELLSPDEYQFRKQIRSLATYLESKGATVVFTSQPDDTGGQTLQYVTDGTILLERDRDVRYVRVPKFRGSGVLTGDHVFRITDDGLKVAPELMPEAYGQSFVAEPISSGIPEMDELLHGGLERGTTSVLSGPTGVGKTTTGTQFMKEAAGRGERSVVYLFEENEATFMERSEAVNIPVKEMRERGTLSVEVMEPLETTPQEFCEEVRREVEEEDARIVMIDGIKGYSVSARDGEESHMRRLHALCRYLKNMGVTVVLVDETASVTGEFRATDSSLSYIADNIIFLRHVELQGELRKVIGVLKKRTSGYERLLRELEITANGIKVGEPLTNLRGILTGTPELASNPDPEGRRPPWANANWEPPWLRDDRRPPWER
ncbi:ATPase domain-containing protein [Halocalculus aciditolerans]|uniref:non-specific serine/threonine protein kinase n=1 Tax=Halocalculus aciditolerans TaxID=1383812 RepID=A0A830F9Y7_9EURY|nr:ATPase domain-containing protein [Halocalculus aciditolerans]GGL54526.1 serine/threonine protein kinase [Halocalculus aciditolerans]